MEHQHPNIQQFSQIRLFKGGLREFEQQIIITKKKIARGGFGEVHEGLINENQQKIAIKEYNDKIQIGLIEKELKNLDKIDEINPYIIRCIGIYAWIQKEIDEKVKVLIIFPLALGDVYEICKQGTLFTEQEVEKMLENVLLGLRFLKKKIGLIHRDIKPSNILKMAEGTYCITDFGISKIVEIKEDNHTITTSQLQADSFEGLSLIYAAPEVLQLYMMQKQAYQEKKSIQLASVDILKGDIFSLGITCLQIAFNLQIDILKQMNGEWGESLRQIWLEKIHQIKLRETLKGMLQQDPKNRFNIEQSISCLLLGPPSGIKIQQQFDQQILDQSIIQNQAQNNQSVKSQKFIKLQFNQVIHLHRQRPNTFQQLLKLASEKYNNLPEVVYFHFIDEEDDEFSIQCDEDLINLYDSVPQGKTPKILIECESTIIRNSKLQHSEKVVENGVDQFKPTNDFSRDQLLNKMVNSLDPRLYQTGQLKHLFQPVPIRQQNENYEYLI